MCIGLTLYAHSLWFVVHIIFHQSCRSLLILPHSQLSKSQRNTVLIGTHNVTLNNPLAKDEEDEERRYHSGQRNTPAILLLT